MEILNFQTMKLVLISYPSVENDTSTLTLNSHYKPNDLLFANPDHFIYRFKDLNFLARIHILCTIKLFFFKLIVFYSNVFK